ncbi:MAG: metallophosphoesterase family protein [Marinicella pacifica]
MKRRQFIKTSIALASAPLVLTHCRNNPTDLNNKKIKGFIFSDAHLGWTGKDQPSQNIQKQTIEIIVRYFDDLDLVFDTGDIHHGNLREKQRLEARDFWLTNMAGQFPNSLFHYIPGNHELGSGRRDAELTAAQIGSFTFRPYYSFDYKGIHFISLPQLQDTILISQEALNWLKLDLELNKDKTSLIFSHNSLSETTFNNNATGYRVTVNSDQVYNIINKHGNVLAWFHGHNHQYEIVKKHQRLYISNGRIGGFNPPQSWGDFGQGHLGGIYFEIDSLGLTVKCFSATKNDFFENFGLTHLSNHISHQTSFKPSAPMNYFWGHGMLHGNATFDFYNHYLTHQDSQILTTNNPLNSLNANHDLRFKTDFKIDRGDIKKFIGYQIKPKSIAYTKVNEGIKISPSQDQPFYIKLPIENYKLGTLLGRSGYYRCALGDNYQLRIALESSNKTDIHIQFKIMDINHITCFESKQWQKGNIQPGSAQFDIQIPKKLPTKPIDHRLYLFITIRFSNNQMPVILKSIDLQPLQLKNNDTEERLFVGNHRLKLNNQINFLKLNNQSDSIKLYDIISPKTLHIKTPNIEWQVRNATASMTKTGLKIHQPRHQFQKNKQIIITPTTQKDFYINELLNITSCHISIFSNRISIQAIEMKTEATVIINATSKPVKTVGAKLVDTSKSRYICKTNSQNVNIYF